MGLLFCFVDLHPHLLVQGRDFVRFAGMLGDLVIQILYIGCSRFELAVHTNIPAFKRYHGFSPTVYLSAYIFIHFCTFQKPLSLSLVHLGELDNQHVNGKNKKTPDR